MSTDRDARRSTTLWKVSYTTIEEGETNTWVRAETAAEARAAVRAKHPGCTIVSAKSTGRT